MANPREQGPGADVITALDSEAEDEDYLPSNHPEDLPIRKEDNGFILLRIMNVMTKYPVTRRMIQILRSGMNLKNIKKSEMTREMMPICWNFLKKFNCMFG